MTLIADNNIIGHLILRNPHDDLTEFRLGFIIINQIFRKKGYEKKLIQAAIDFAKKEYGAKNFNLGVFIDNDNAIECYKFVGFEVITKQITWAEANKNDWRKSGNWQPGWEYEID